MTRPWDAIGAGVGWVVIVRGLPGVGKTTFVDAEVSRISRGAVFSPDLYFYQSGEYVFQKTKIGEAHAWCRVSYLQALVAKESLIFLDYPFVERWQYEDYEWMAILAGYRVAIVEVKLASGDVETLVRRNKHGVPIEVIKGMRKKWYVDERAIKILIGDVEG